MTNKITAHSAVRLWDSFTLRGLCAPALSPQTRVCISRPKGARDYPEGLAPPLEGRTADVVRAKVKVETGVGGSRLYELKPLRVQGGVGELS